MGHIRQRESCLETSASTGFSVQAKSGRRAAGSISGERDELELFAVLSAGFPVVRRLVGDDSFRTMAHRFIGGGPRNATLLRAYADTFPRFLRSQSRAASFAYVADIAELELAYSKARACSGAPAVSAGASLSLPAERFEELRIRFLPSMALVASRFPIVTIWENNRRGGHDGSIERWGGEAALVARPALEVRVWRLPPGGHVFFAALADGQAVAAAAAAARVTTPDFELAANRAILIRCGVVVGFCKDTGAGT